MNVFRRFDFLIALYIFGIMVAELMGAKTAPLFTIGSLSLSTSVTILMMPLLFTLTDIVAEVYGRAQARRMVFTGLGMVFLVMLFALFATHLPPSARFAPMEDAYDTVFGMSVRMSLASIAAFAASELLDLAIFMRLRQKMHGRALWLRNNVSNIVSQLIDSTVFMTVAFYAFDISFKDNWEFLAGAILPYWLVRSSFSALQTPLVYIGVRWLKKDMLLLPKAQRKSQEAAEAKA